MAIKTTTKFEKLLKQFEDSGQSESVMLAEFVREALLADEGADKGLIQSSMEVFVEAATELMKLAESEKL